MNRPTMKIKEIHNKEVPIKMGVQQKKVIKCVRN